MSLLPYLHRVVAERAILPAADAEAAMQIILRGEASHAADRGLSGRAAR